VRAYPAHGSFSVWNFRVFNEPCIFYEIIL
jgi:hypothetical protein